MIVLNGFLDSDRQSWNDEFTTGAVLEYCTEQLIEAGGREIGRK